ncbi:MAG TPA: TlpA disulfide reductase family protein [Pirellulaceae bacterium]|jgi:thiol-disulfide isomerase/thioredoxin|nr:TlpA disulfide reductase family protein [Pirellulaceae bacterium]
MSQSNSLSRRLLSAGALFAACSFALVAPVSRAVAAEDEALDKALGGLKRQIAEAEGFTFRGKLEYRAAGKSLAKAGFPDQVASGVVRLTREENKLSEVQFRIEVGEQEDERNVYAYDGETLEMVDYAAKTAKAGAAEWERFLAGEVWETLLQIGGVPRDTELILEIERDGQKKDKGRTSMLVSVTPAGGDAKDRDRVGLERVVVYLDPETGDLHKIEQHHRVAMTPGSRPVRATITLDFEELTLLQQVDPQSLAYSVPAGFARQPLAMQARSQLAVDVGEAAPDFQLADLSGRPQSIAQHAGKYVLLDFWATWCGPCQRALPEYERLYQGFRGDLVVLAINTSERSPEDLPKWLQENRYSFPILPNGDQIASGYGVRGLPTSVLIDPTGKVAAIHVGFSQQAVQAIAAEVQAGRARR